MSDDVAFSGSSAGGFNLESEAVLNARRARTERVARAFVGFMNVAGREEDATSYDELDEEDADTAWTIAEAVIELVDALFASDDEHTQS